MANEAANEYVVDDSDADFELVDANKTMIQHYFPPKHSYRTLQGGHTNCWKDVLGTRFQGDSIRGARIISGGNGKSTATWRATLPIHLTHNHSHQRQDYKETKHPAAHLQFHFIPYNQKKSMCVHQSIF